jgi:hypothetical protein
MPFSSDRSAARWTMISETCALRAPLLTAPFGRLQRAERVGIAARDG